MLSAGETEADQANKKTGACPNPPPVSGALRAGRQRKMNSMRAQHPNTAPLYPAREPLSAHPEVGMQCGL